MYGNHVFEQIWILWTILVEGTLLTDNKIFLNFPYYRWSSKQAPR